MNSGIRCMGVTKSFGSGAIIAHVLRGIDLTVERGEFVYLSGPSGSGKTTLLSIIGCVLRPTTGEIWLGDTELGKIKESQLARFRLEQIGFIFQGHNLLGAINAEENVAFPLRLRGWSTGKALATAREMLHKVGLGERLKHLPEQLSGGQRQRVAVARALAGSPPFVFADEPTASLDAQSGLKVTEILRTLAKEQGCTVLMVSHDSRVFHLADRILHIEDGLIIPQTEHAA
ncbi:MAG: ABC transporter ATP-binding protein [Candidatus Sumerlaeia bacterium]|nr:ABC transporter ATP-binding protein [Candidatus Sumerlaeia bacterium]